MGNTGRRSALVLVAIVALAAGFAAESSAGGEPATAAKKKCKKKGGGTYAAIAKKRCKKKGPVPYTPPPPPPAAQPPAPSPPAPPSPPPTLRAEMPWSFPAEADIDLFVTDDQGNIASVGDTGGIPDALHDGDVVGAGTERFFDQESPTSRTFSYYACHSGGAGLTSVQFTGYHPNGTASSLSGVNLGGFGDQSFLMTSPPGAPTNPAPPGDWCPDTPRATLEWDTFGTGAANWDMHVFTASGNHASPTDRDGIGRASHGGDVAGAGPETFADKILPYSPNRTLYFYACKTAGPGGTPPNLTELELILQEPPFARAVRPIGQYGVGDELFIASIPNTAAFPPPFTLPNFCP